MVYRLLKLETRFLTLKKTLYLFINFFVAVNVRPNPLLEVRAQPVKVGTFGNQTLVVRLGGKYFYLLSYLADPQTWFYILQIVLHFNYLRP